MLQLKQSIFIIISLINFIVTVYTVIKLILFLSGHGFGTGTSSTSEQILFLIQHSQLNSINDDIIRPLTYNASLIIVFMLQHSVMKQQYIKDTFVRWNCNVIQRTIYTLFTSFTLLLLVDNWKSIYLYPLWCINGSNDGVLWWLFNIIHVIAWSFIYGGAILMDIPELIGIKQVYYNVMDWLDPLAYKSKSLQRLYTNMRHPSFIGFLIILWITPFMTVDRLLLASVLTTYMYCSWKTTQPDYDYQQDQFIRKKYSLQ